jgi:hypothetical protein
MPTDSYSLLLAKIEAQQAKLSQLSTHYEELTRQAYLQARDDISFRMTELINSRGGLGGLSGRDRWRLTRDTGLIENIDGRLTELGIEHTNIVKEAFQESGSLARMHLGDELSDLVTHLNKVSGTALPISGVVNFAQLDTAAIELGLGTALNDTSALTQATRITLQREITAGVASGEGIAKLSRRIDGLEGISANRAEVITRWTTIKGYNSAHQATYEAAMVTIPGLKKEWFTQVDERTCPHCLAQHGTVVEIVEEFDPNLTYASTPPQPYQGMLETPPLHPRCRCTIASWHEDWRAYTSSTPQEQSSFGRDKSIQQGHPRASTAGVTGVAPQTGIKTAASNALGDMMRGVYVLDDFSGSVRIVDGADLNAARLALRDAGFRVREYADDPRLFKIEFPRGLTLPRTIRNTKLKALSDARWKTIKEGLLACGLKK